MKPLLAILIFLFVTNVYSQEQSKFYQYDKLVWCAMIHYKDKEYNIALEKFDRAFIILPRESPDDYFFAAASALHLKRKKKAKELIIQAIVQTNANKEYFLNFEDFQPFRSQQMFKDIEKKYDKYQDLFFKNTNNPDIYTEIKAMIENDQKVRVNGENFDAVDYHNSTRLIEITKKYGWQESAWLILWHQRGEFESNNYFWSFFRPYINTQISEGNIRKDFWARFEDDKSTGETGKQIYGMYWSQFDDLPIRDIENLDKIRFSVGLPPIWYMEKVYGIAPPKNYSITTESIQSLSCNLIK